jgi:carboxymethylenebutenolidase
MFFHSKREAAMRPFTLILPGIVAVAGGAIGVASARGDVDPHAHHDVGEATGPSGRGVAVHQQSALPAAGPDAPARLAASTRGGEWAHINVGDADSVVAWVVSPANRQNAPVVVVIHDNQGQSAWARAVADQLAADGFIGIAPDLLTMKRAGNHRADWTGDSARAVIGQLTDDQVQRALDAVAKHGMSLGGARPSYGVVGFCWGGARSFLHAVHAPSLGAAVVYYGSSPAPERLAAIKAPVLGLYGGSDARITAAVPATDSAMKQAGKAFEYEVYDGAGHGFLRNQSGENGANLAASQKAWPRTIAFLRAKLTAK